MVRLASRCEAEILDRDRTRRSKADQQNGLPSIAVDRHKGVRDARRGHRDPCGERRRRDAEATQVEPILPARDVGIERFDPIIAEAGGEHEQVLSHPADQGIVASPPVIVSLPV